MITILGSSGFIGSHLVKKVKEFDIPYFSPGRDDELSHKDLGDIIYCIGLTADFRTKPFETVNAHVCNLLKVLQQCNFDSLLYLSSARLYKSQVEVAREENPIQVDPSDPSDLYNISKAMGESLSLTCGRKTRIVRLSRVYGEDFASNNFLSAVLKEALCANKVTLQTSLDSESDYVSVEDVVDILIRIATQGRYQVYNVASGTNVSNRELMERISDLTGCEIEVAPKPSQATYPHINVDRIKEEFGFSPANILHDVDRLVKLYRRHHQGE